MDAHLGGVGERQGIHTARSLGLGGWSSLTRNATDYREYSIGEQLLLVMTQEAALDFHRDFSRDLRSNRDDTAVFGTKAVNAWVNQHRMTQDTAPPTNFHLKSSRQNIADSHQSPTLPINDQLNC